jgi:hypothetical protein
MVSTVQQHPVHKRLGDIVLFVGTDQELQKAKAIIKNTYKERYLYVRYCDMATEMNDEFAYSTHEERKKVNQGATIKDVPPTKAPGTKVYKIYMGGDAVALGRLSALADLPFYALRATILKPLPMQLKRILHAGISLVATVASHGVLLLAHAPEILSYLYNKKIPLWKGPLLANPFYMPRNLEDLEKGPYEIDLPLPNEASFSEETKRETLWLLQIRADLRATNEEAQRPQPTVIEPDGAIEVTPMDVTEGSRKPDNLLPPSEEES